jgi:hypothetical protein
METALAEAFKGAQPDVTEENVQAMSAATS